MTLTYVEQMLPEMRTVHSRAYTTWKAMDKRRTIARNGVDAWMDAEYARYVGLMSQWNRQPDHDREYYRATFPTWTHEDQAMMDDLEKVVRDLNKYALPKKRMP